MRAWLLVAGAGAAMASLTGCSGFFQCEGKAACPATTGSGTGSGSGTTVANTGDFAYVANSTAGTTYLSEYSISSNALNSLGTASLGYIPVALSVAPSNSFLYVASAPGYTQPGVYRYAIGSSGTLSGGTFLATDEVAAMTISPDGGWLFTVNVDGTTMNEYQVNTTTGALSLASVISLPVSTCSLSASTPVSQSCSVAVSPEKDYVVVALGIQGDAVLSYTPASGITGTSLQTIPSGYSTSNPTGDFSVAMDTADYAYVARTSTLTVFQLQAAGITNRGTITYPTGYNPRSLTLSRSYNFVYTANEGNGSISGFGIGGSGSLTALAGSNYPGPPGVSALGIDNSGSYLLAAGYDGSAGVRLYSIASTGALTQVAQTGSGTNEAYPSLVAMTH